MGKLPIIPQGADIPEDTSAVSREERSAVIVVGDATISGAVADREPIGEIAPRQGCTRGKSAESGGTDHPIEAAIGANAAARSIAARIRRRDAVAITRLHGHTRRENETVQTDTDRTGSTWSYVIGNDRGRDCAVLDAALARPEQRNRTAGDDRDVTIATIASFFARRVRTRDRVTRSSLIGRIERRNRRRGDASPVCSESIAVSIDSTEMEKTLRHATVNSITESVVERNRFSGSTIADITDVPSDGTKNTRRSAVTVFELSRELAIGSDVNAEGTDCGTSDRRSQRFADDDPVSSCRNGLIARLIGIADFTGAKRSLFPAERVDVSGSSSSSQLPAKIDPGGSRRTKTGDTCCSGPLPRICFVLRAFLLGLLAMCLLCDVVMAAPSSSSSSSLSSILEHSHAMGSFEDGIEEEELAISRNKLGEDELEIIRRSIVQGLGLQRIPDPSKVRLVSRNAR